MSGNQKVGELITRLLEQLKENGTVTINKNLILYVENGTFSSK
jgi:hypothetical protein